MDRVKKEKFECVRDGLTIRGHVFGRSSSPKKAVILSHGFLANEESVKGYALMIARLGYVTFTYDFCGGGIVCSSDGASEDMTVFTEVKDLKSVIAYVKSLRCVIPEEVSILGCSQGGFVSALTAAELKEEISSLIMLYPALCIPDDARKGDMLIYRFDPENIPDIIGNLPMKLGGDYARTVMDFDPFEAIKGYGGRTLLIHGTKDEIVDVSYSRRAVECYEDISYTEIEGGKHGFKGVHEKEARAAITSFLSQDSE